MRVCALHSFVAAGHRAYSEGDQFDLPEAEAIEWIRAGLVARLPASVRTATVHAPETAVSRRTTR